LTDVVTALGVDEAELLRLAGALERQSEHPLAGAIVEGIRARGIDIPEAAYFEAIPGHGVEGRVEGRALLLGNLKLMRDREIETGRLEETAAALAADGKTPMYVAVGGRIGGLVAVADTVKEDSRDAIRALKRMGLEVVMITGDNRRTAEAIARQVGRRPR